MTLRYRLLLLPLVALACKNAEDQAAKARIFSPEDPPKVLQAARETIDSSALHERPALVERVFSISGQEAAFRLGAHEQVVKAKFQWKRGNKTVSLSEDRMVAVDPAGDFHVKVENDERQGMEWIRAKGVSYSRSRFASFRERRRDRGSSEHVLSEAYATLETFHRLVHGALKLHPAKSETIEGRSAVVYDVSLGTPWEVPDDRLPEVVFPKDGPDEDTRLRLHALENGRATSVSGELWIDEETGVPLRADLGATVEVPGEDDNPSFLEFTVKLTVGKMGGPLDIAPPEHLDDAPRPPGAVATLKAYGLYEVEEAQQEEAPEE